MELQEENHRGKLPFSWSHVKGPYYHYDLTLLRLALTSTNIFFLCFFFLFSFFLTSTNIKVEWKSLSRVWLFATPCTVVHGILQARILEWVAFPFSRGSSQPRDRTHARLRNISSYSNLHRFLIHYYLDHSSRLPLLICTLLFHQWETGSRLLPSISLVIWAQYTVSQY